MKCLAQGDNSLERVVVQTGNTQVTEQTPITVATEYCSSVRDKAVLPVLVCPETVERQRRHSLLSFHH